MALFECPDCSGKVSDQAKACPHCGRPSKQPPKANSASTKDRNSGDCRCPHCNKMVTPVVTLSGSGGSCAVGGREKWTCPACRKTIQRTGCFVATATYGDEDEIEVRFLRVYRDRVLRNSWIGNAFIYFYYQWGPYLARIVEKLPLLKPLCRWCLDNVIKLIERRTDLSRDAIRQRLRVQKRFNPRESDKE